MADNRVSYLNKTFSEFKNSLINYAKTYFPTAYNNFSEANPGALFIDMASYIGDVSSFYLDTQIQENFLLYAKEKENLYALSYMFGYSPKISYASNVEVDMYQLIPAKDDPNNPGNLIIDKDYYLIIPENTVLTSANTGTKFLTTELLDFSDPNDREVRFVDNNYFLLKKSAKAISAEIKSSVIAFNGPAEKFAVRNITDNNILQILDVTDAEGNKWYEVPYLAQSTVLDKVTNSSYSTDNVSYLLSYRKVSRRFVSRFLSDNTLQLEFGSGIGYSSDNSILPNPDKISLGLIPGINNNYINNYNKASSFFTQEYGLAPSSNLTVRYLVGGGIKSNVPANDLTIVDKTKILFKNTIFNSTTNTTTTFILNSIASTNPEPAAGGRDGDKIEELRNNALYAYQSQLRAVTREDYMVRALSLPSDYGSIAKVYVTQDMAMSSLSTSTVAYTEERNPLSLDMYILAYDVNKKLTTAAPSLKQNLAKYINQYRMVTDAINIKNAFYINIGVNFDIVIQSGYNSNDVVTNCILSLKNFFNIENWSINQPIILSDVVNVLLQTKGVQSVPKLEITNKQDPTGITYSQYAYDISGATRQGNVYPSIDPSIFEVRYPDTDIQGRVVPFVI